MTSRRWNAFESIPYREVLNAPGIGRAHDVQRLFSYGLGIAVGLILDLPAWRALPVVLISAAMFLAALIRLTTKLDTNPYPLAQADLLLASIVVAVATASLPISVAVAGFVAIAIGATFEVPHRLTITTGIIVATVAGTAAAVVDLRSDDGGADYLEALVLIVLLLAITLLILGFFTIQARQLRNKLTRRERQLNAVLDVTPVVLASVDRNGTMTNLTGSVESWLEPDRQGPEKEEIDSLLGAIARGERVARNVTLADRVFSVTCEPGVDGTGLLTAYDITEQIETQRRLEGLVRSKDQFIAAVSHELRTPLSSVLGFAELIKDEIEDEDPLQPMIGEVADQSAEMAAIIDDLLVAARSSFEAVPTAPRLIDLSAEAAAVADTIGPRLIKNPECDLTAVTAYADPIRVRQIIRNLLTNADRYGGNRIRITTSITADQAVLEVRDNGTPLPPELRDRIFEPYESSGPVRGQPAAIGLGLAVSRTLAELMGGSVAYTHDGGWSSFVLILPQTAAQSHPQDHEIEHRYT